MPSDRRSSRFSLLAVCMLSSACQLYVAMPAHAQALASRPAVAVPSVASTGSRSLPAGVVAIVNGVPIPSAQLDAAVQAAHATDSAPLRQTLTQQLIIREVLRQNAEKAHYDSRAEVRQAMHETQVAVESQLYLKDTVHPQPISDTQVRARYDALTAALGSEEYRVHIITVPDDATAAVVLGQLKQGAAFDALARQYSIAPSRANGGELGWVSFKMPLTEGHTQGLPLPIAQAIVGLPGGGITPAAVAFNGGRAIVRVDQKRPTQIPEFAQAQQPIRQQLQSLALQQATANALGAMLANSTIQK